MPRSTATLRRLIVTVPAFAALGLGGAACLPVGIDFAEYSEPAFEEECIPAEWIEQAEDLSGPTAPFAFDLEVSSVRVHAVAVEIDALSAVCGFERYGDGAPSTDCGPMVEVLHLVFADAILADGRRGALSAPASILLTQDGELTDLEAAEFHHGDAAYGARLARAEDDGKRPPLGPAPDPEDVAFLEDAVPFQLRAAGLQVDASGPHRLYHNGIVETLTPGEVIESASGLYMLPGEYGLESDPHLVAQTIEARFSGDVQIELSDPHGETSPELPELPEHVVGTEARLRLEPGRVRTLEDMTVRQVYRGDAFYAADVEVRLCHGTPIVLNDDGIRRLRLAIREKSGKTDAVLDGLEIVADEQALTIYMDVDEALPDGYFADPFGPPAVAERVAETAHDGPAILGASPRPAGCLFTLFTTPCGGGWGGGGSGPQPPDLAIPMPRYLPPGGYAEFEVEVYSDLSPGPPHAAEVRVTGLNFVAVLPIEIGQNL